jgi:hypothetical protein
VASVTLFLSVLSPAIYAVVIDRVMVRSPDVLLNIEIASPAEKVLFGTVIDPPDPMPIKFPTSLVVKL